MDRLRLLFSKVFSEEPTSVIPITGSASNRQYYRLTGDKASCIGVLGVDAKENHAFLYMAQHFASKGISVPEILAVNEDKMAYLLSDLGNEALYDRYVKAGKSGEGTADVDDLLCRTMAALPKIQFEGAEGLDFEQCYSIKCFDRRFIMFDLNYFKYCFLKPSGLEFDEVALQEDFEHLADDLLVGADTQTFLYRDFNSRNVMINNEEPYFIDFQGGLQGPIYYDVASFVWHARSGYAESLKEKMLQTYLNALSKYTSVDETAFRTQLRKYVLFRSLQVLAAYGFRGLVEQKANFVVGIPAAITALGDILKLHFDEYPYLMTLLESLTKLPKFASQETEEGVLEVKVCSFSFKKGVPQDMSGNGGGYVFDCRSIHNPGRYAPYKALTGKDEPVIRFLEEDGEIIQFLEHVYGVVDPHVETYASRGFTSLMVSFGCTGGQHRSVYCAEHLAHHLASKFPNVRIRLTHREQAAYPPQLFNWYTISKEI